MPRLARLILVSALLTAATMAHAGPPDFVPPAPVSSTPPVGSSFGLWIASTFSGQNVPRGSVGQVPEPETWIFTLAGLAVAALLRRRKR